MIKSFIRFDIIFFFSLMVLFSCQEEESNFEIISTPCQEGGEPNLHLSSNGTLHLTWIEYHEDSVSLLFSQLIDERWSEPKAIASGSNWFVNWADFPSIVTYQDNSSHLTAHWLQKSAEGTYDYDVRISQSTDGGHSWSDSFVLHSDSVSAEHGFVSLMPTSDNTIFATWLDGRNTKSAVDETDDHGHHGAMSLRAAEMDIDGTIIYDQEIDSKVCDCCQTSAAMTEDGPVVVYRDRSNDEIRDIYISRRVDGKWSTPRAVYHDNWSITGCPVNGPVVVAQDNVVAVAWYSMADESSEVKVAFSYDGGINFDLPVRIDNGNPLGRVDMKMLSKGEVLVSWVELSESGADINIAKVDSKSGVTNKNLLVATDGSRRSGFPRMEILDNNLYLAWTAVDSFTMVKTGILRDIY